MDEEANAKEIVKIAFEAANRRLQEIIKSAFEFGVRATLTQLYNDSEIHSAQYNYMMTKYTVSGEHEDKLEHDPNRNYIKALQEFNQVWNDYVEGRCGLDWLTVRFNEIKDEC